MPLRLTTPAAIVLGAATIAAGIVGAQLVPRYQITAPGYSFSRLNVTTGAIEYCAADYAALDLPRRKTVRCRPDMP